MSSRKTSISSRAATVLMISLAIGASAVSVAQDKSGPPKKTTDGLELVKETKQRLVYLAPDADLTQYTDVAILDCHVAFKKNWQRDYNRDAVSLQGRVNDNDMDRIKNRLAERFKDVFTEELTKEGKHQVVDHVGPEVLVLRPAIINLDVTTADTGKQTSMSRSYNASAGEMTLYLELYDSVTSAIIARVVDVKADRRTDTFQMSNRVTNTATADRILRSWANEFAAHLGEIKQDGS